MKTNIKDISKTAQKLVEKSKAKNLIKSYTLAFKDFPVSEEVHKGKKEYYCK